jgi:ribosomal protein L2
MYLTARKKSMPGHRVTTVRKLPTYLAIARPVTSHNYLSARGRNNTGQKTIRTKGKLIVHKFFQRLLDFSKETFSLALVTHNTLDTNRYPSFLTGLTFATGARGYSTTTTFVSTLSFVRTIVEPSSLSLPG